MAKFSIALCILIVACGAQAATISQSVVTDWAESKIAEVEQLLESLKDAVSNATAAAKAKKEAIESTIQTGLDDWNTMVEEAVAKYVNGSSCIAASVNFTETAGVLLSEVISCVDDLLTTNLAKYEAAVNSSKALIAELKTITVEAKECASDDTSTITCLVELVKSKGSEMTIATWSCAKEIAALITAFENISSDLQACGYSAAIQTVVIQGRKAYATIQECLADLSSTSR